jgi:hypothetical protein
VRLCVIAGLFGVGLLALYLTPPGLIMKFLATLFSGVD